MNASLVQESAVAAAEIDQPKFANVLQMNKRVAARHFRRLQHNRVSPGPSERTTAFDWMEFAIGRFQPGAFLWGRAHADGCYQRPPLDARCLPRTQAPSEGENPEAPEIATTNTAIRRRIGRHRFCVSSGVISGRILPSKTAERVSGSRNDPCYQSLPKVRNRNPRRRA